MTGMECGHRFCIDCWSGFLTSKIRDEGETQTVHCISCKILIDDATVMRLVKDPQVKLKYQHLITNSFIEVNKKYCCLYSFIGLNKKSQYKYHLEFF